MPNIPLIARHRGSSACGVTPQDAPRAAYHTRTPERAPDREGKRGVPWLHTLCGVRYAMPHRVSPPPEQGSPITGCEFCTWPYPFVVSEVIRFLSSFHHSFHEAIA